MITQPRANACPSWEAVLEQLIAIPSVTGEEAALGHWIEDWLTGRGIPVRRQFLPGSRRFNLLIRLETEGDDRARWLLGGHLDTVPPAAGWVGDPWHPRRLGPRLVGLGAWDMKAGLAALLNVAESWRPGKPPLRIALLVDEEGESQGAQLLLTDPFLAGVGGAIFPEAGGEMTEAGHLTLIRGRVGRVLLRLEVVTPTAHAASATHEGALVRAARLVLALERLPTATHPRLGPGQVLVRQFQSSSRGALSLPAEALLLVDRLLVPPETPEQAVTELAEFLDREQLSCGVQVSCVPRAGRYSLPFLLPDNHPLVQRVTTGLARGGLRLTFGWDRSPADENQLMQAGIPTISLCPRGGHAHQPEEWVELDSLALLVAGLREVVADPPPDWPAHQRM